MASKKSRKSVKSSVETVAQSDMARAVLSKGATPDWKIFLDSRSREKKEEGLKYTGGPTGAELQS